MQGIQAASQSTPPPYPQAVTYPPLHHESRLTVNTACAAWHLGRQPQTLQVWACRGIGPIRPLRVNGRLAWPVADLIRVQGGVRVVH